MKKYVTLLLFIALVLIVFRNWFLPGLISAGDFWPYYQSMFGSRPIPLTAWDFNNGYGLGGFSGPFLWIHLNFSWSIFFFGKILGMDWTWIERLGYMYPFLILSAFSPYLLFKKLFKNHFGALFASFIFIFNTYTLMLVGGGQFAGVGMSFVLLPITLLSFIKIVEREKDSISLSLLAGLLFSVQTILDIRIAYATAFAVLLFLLVNHAVFKNYRKFIFVFLIPGTVTLLINAFWILPSVIIHQNPLQQLGPAYTSIEAVKFFSFAKLEQAISILHPNWPENVFGKVGFMKPEFFLLPLLAFLSLLFANKEKDSTRKLIIFFVLLALAGAFLAKGTNEPFGEVYMTLFNKMPGFQLFRDPTKWYIFVVVSYSVLIPFSVIKLFDFLCHRKGIWHSRLRFLLVTGVVAYFLFLLRPVILGDVKGAFKATSIPSEYILLERMLSKDNAFYRTFWVPTYQRFSYYSTSHPSISGSEFYKKINPVVIAQELKKTQVQEFLNNASVRYVIVPLDSEGEIFLTDRKYDEKKYEQVIAELSKNPHFIKVDTFKELAVFESRYYRDHFWSNTKGTELSYGQLSPTEYRLEIKNAKKDEVIVFSESFDSHWTLFDDSSRGIPSEKYLGVFNSFKLPRSGYYVVNVVYTPQRLVDIGSAVSLVTFIFILSYFSVTGMRALLRRRLQ